MNSIFRKIYETSPQDIYRYFANRKRQSDARGFIYNYIENNEIRKLQVGCGGNFMEGWLNSDLVPNSKEIALLDASKPFPIPTGCFDYIYSEHFIEHLDFFEQLNFLKESFRILKQDGKIRIATPDFNFLSQLASGNKNNEFEMEYLKWNIKTFLPQMPSQLINTNDLQVYVINNYFRDWGHQLIHSHSSLSNLLMYCGFNILGFEKVGQSSDPVFQGIERHGEMITDVYNEYETMIIEAVRP